MDKHKDVMEEMVLKDCPVCKEEYEVPEETVRCPICGHKLREI